MTQTAQGSTGSGLGSRGPAPDPRRWRALILLCLAQLMLIVDVTVVNVALPSIARRLTLGPGSLTWVLAAYSLTFGGLLLIGGRLADAIGRRRAFLLGMALFTGASLASGLATSGSVLIGARAAQGVGAALLSPAAMSIVTTTFHGAQRTRALGVWAAIGGSGAAFGVLVGGVLTSGPGWRWVFFVNVPIGLLVLALLPRYVRASAPAGRDSSGADGKPYGSAWRGLGLRGLDLGGALFGTVTAGALIYGLVHAGESGWASGGTAAAFALAVVSGIGFVLAERISRSPLIPAALAARRPLMSGTAVMSSASSVMLIGFYLCSWYAQHLLGLSALRTGLVFLPAGITVIAGAHSAANALGRFGFRRVASAAFVVAAAGAALLARVPESGSVYVNLLPGFAVLGLGLGATFVVAGTSAMDRVDPHQAGLSSGIVSTGHELGGAFGVALGTLLAASSLTGAGVGGLHKAFLVAALFAGVMAVLAPAILPKGRPDTSNGPVFAH